MSRVASARRLLGRSRQVLALAGVTYAGLALSVLSAPMLAMALGASGRGQLAAAFAAIQVMGFVAFLGLPRGVAVQDSREASASRQAVVLVGALGILSALACFAAAEILSGGDAWVAGAIRIASVVLALTGVYQIGVERLLLTSRLGVYNLSRVFNVILPSLGYIVAFLLGALTLELAFVISLIGQLAGSLVGVVSSFGVLARTDAKKTPWRFSLSMWSSTVVDGVAWRMDQVVLAIFASSATLGIYAVASTVANASGGLTQALNTVLYGRFAVSEEGGSARTGRVRLIALVSSCVTSTAVITAIGLWQEQLLGPTYGGLMVPLVLLCIAQALNDQWQLQVYRQAAAQKSAWITAPSWGGLVALGAAAFAFGYWWRLDAATMAIAVLIGAVVRLALREAGQSLDHRRERVETRA